LGDRPPGPQDGLERQGNRERDVCRGRRPIEGGGVDRNEVAELVVKELVPSGAIREVWRQCRRGKRTEICSVTCCGAGALARGVEFLRGVNSDALVEAEASASNAPVCLEHANKRLGP